MTILEVAESLKNVQPARPDPTVTHIDGLFLGNYEK